jgi:probable O-glycosylation ligase (exosortase A-associated)
MFVPAAGAALVRPWIGPLLLAWLSYMNPHRLCYGFAWSGRWFAIAAAISVLSLLITREPKWIPWSREIVLLLLFVLWTNVTYLFALNPREAHVEWDRWMKIQFTLLLNLMIMQDRFRLRSLIWVIVLSLGFFGVKGGIFAIMTGGNYRVQGPAYSFIEDNNHLALALTMTLPLMRYLQLSTVHRLVRLGLAGMMGLTILAIIASYSRAGFIALSVVSLMLIWKSRRRVVSTVALVACVSAILSFMPEQWKERVRSIRQYDADASAQGRFNAWRFAMNLAADRPLVGGGFRTFTPELFRKYAPEPEDHHDAHSIYFEILGEQGIPGILLFLTMGVLTWRTAARLNKIGRDDPEFQWASDLSAMIQVSLAAYAVAGGFVGLGYFDLPYHLMVIVALTKSAVRNEAAELEEASAESPAPAVAYS